MRLLTTIVTVSPPPAPAMPRPWVPFTMHRGQTCTGEPGWVFELETDCAVAFRALPRHDRHSRGLAPREHGTPLWTLPVVLLAMAVVGLVCVLTFWALGLWAVWTYLRERARG